MEPYAYTWGGVSGTVGQPGSVTLDWTLEKGGSALPMASTILSGRGRWQLVTVALISGPSDALGAAGLYFADGQGWSSGPVYLHGGTRIEPGWLLPPGWAGVLTGRQYASGQGGVVQSPHASGMPAQVVLGALRYLPPA